ncbi:MAG: AAA family ATPase [Burkholderiales bacterium]
MAAQVSPLVAQAWATRDQWQVIDQVSTLELGGADNSARYRTLAEAGGTLVEWLAAHEHSLGTEHGLAIAAEAYLATGRGAGAGVDAAAQGKAQSHRLDLSQIVSKYIGETEKNLAMVFGRAQPSDAVLLFDEADALFGKRTDVKDSHDRYASAAVNASPQPIEDPERTAMLATNGHEPIDPDGLKRLREPVQLPTPPAPPRSRG